MSNKQIDSDATDVSREPSPVAGLKRHGTVVLVPQPTDDPKDPLVRVSLKCPSITQRVGIVMTIILTDERRIGLKAGSTAFWRFFALLASLVSPRLWQINWALKPNRSSMERL
jgi:hypothetical protein